MKSQSGEQSRLSILGIVLIILGAVVLTAGGWVFYKHDKVKETDMQARTQTTKQNTRQETETSAQPTTITYNSDKEQASFRYPSNWTLARPYTLSSNANNTDYVGLVSPSGAIKISYVTDISGFGNEHTASYPLNKIVDKTAIPAAPGLYVVSAVTTLDGMTYYPWIAVQDSNGILASGVKGNLVTFDARHAINPSTNDLTNILFATCGPRSNENDPALTQDQATTWLSSAEAQEAKQIMLSFSDQ